MSGPVHHFHAERTRLAAALFVHPTFELGGDEDVARRVAALTGLIALSPLRVPRPRPILSATFGELKLADGTAADDESASSSESAFVNRSPRIGCILTRMTAKPFPKYST